MVYGSTISIVVLLALVVGVYSQSSVLPQIGLVHRWTLDADAKDAVGNINGVVTGAVLKPGLFGQAYSFDGDNDYINLGNYTTAEEKTYTVSAWFKTDYTGREDIFGRGRSGNCYYNPAIYLQNGRVIASESSCNSDGRIGGQYYPGVPISLGDWNHVVLTRDGNTTKLYVNGYLQVTDNIIHGTPPNDYSRVTIGAMFHTNNAGYGNSFRGLIDDVAVWNRAISASEVESIYNQVYPEAQPPAKLDISYEQAESFTVNKTQFSDKYKGDKDWSVDQGSWVVENGVLKNINGATIPRGDIITLDSYDASPGKSLRVKVKQSGNYRSSFLYSGYQDKNNAYYVVLDATNRRVDIRRTVGGVNDSIGLEMDIQKNTWYDV